MKKEVVMKGALVVLAFVIFTCGLLLAALSLNSSSGSQQGASENASPRVAQVAATQHAPLQKQQSQTMKNPNTVGKHKMSRANVVGSKEGAETLIFRQIRLDPAVADYRGDVQDRAAVKKFVSQLAVRAGLVDKLSGADIRVRIVDQVAYVIQKDDGGNLKMNIWNGDQLVETVAVAKSYATAQFRGAPGHKLQSFEYLNSSS